MSGVVNPAFNATEEFGEKLPDDSQYEEIDLSGKAADEVSDGAKPDVDQDNDARCGWCFIRPNFLQGSRTAKWALFWLCWAGAFQGMVVNGFVNVVITTIERRFSMRSSQTGLIAGGYDIASFLCLVPVTYLGGRPKASKPRWLGWGVLIMGLGSLVFTVPHFAVGPNYHVSHIANTCNTTDGSRTMCDVNAGDDRVSDFMWVFLAGQLLHGSGASPLYTLGVTYIDENVSKKMSSVYLGIYYTTAIIGPALGYVVGGEFLKIYSDALYVDPSEHGLTPNSKVWVGAWWIGFLLAGGLCMLLSIPLLAFPPALPGSAAIQAEKVSEAHGGSSRTRSETYSKLIELPRAFRNLLSNPTFFFLNLAGASEGLLLAGFAAFLPKLIENQFSVNPSMAALVVGMITVPAGGGGTFLGGYLVKRLNLHCAGIIKMCIGTTICGGIFSLCFFLSCPNLNFAGLTSPYANSSEVLTLESSCNAGCSCSRRDYNPVCGVDDTMYFSPCFAGCSEEILLPDSMLYSNCSCILHAAQGHERSSTSKPLMYQAINQTCSANCPYLWAFVILAFITMIFTFLTTMPALSATLRCVRDDQRSFALGIQWITVRLLGTIPSPMIFGGLIDRTCILWQESCDDNSACLVYANSYMGRYMFSLAIIGKACSLLFFFLAWWFYVPPSGLQEALQAGTPTSPDGGESSGVPSTLMNGHTNQAQDDP